MRGDDFWSRRRARVAAEQEAEAAEVAAAARQAAEEALEEKTDAEILEELDLPDPDGPQITTFSPARTVRLMSFST